MADFLAATRGAPAHPSLTRALRLWSAEPGFALDLGCGAGRDSLHLLAQGWGVTALDRDPQALSTLALECPDEDRPRLQLLQRSCEDAGPLPAANLINASFALPFCPPAAFPALWQRIAGALCADGLFVGHFFADRDAWAGERPLTVHDRTALLRLFDSWETVHFEEHEWDGKTAVGQRKHWHLFEVIARRT
jgi:tellurite methyltransferase